MQMRENNRFFSFALDSAHVKFDVWTGPYSSWFVNFIREEILISVIRDSLFFLFVNRATDPPCTTLYLQFNAFKYKNKNVKKENKLFQ